MSTLRPGDAVLINRGKIRGHRARYVAPAENYEGLCWIAISKSDPSQPPSLNHYTNQSRAPRKLVPLSWLEPIEESIIH